MAFSPRGMGLLPSSPAGDPLELLVPAAAEARPPPPRKPWPRSAEPGRRQDAPLLLPGRARRPSPRPSPRLSVPTLRARQAPGQVGGSPAPRAAGSSASAQRARGWSGAGRGGAGRAGANGHAPGSRAGGGGLRARTLGMEGECRAAAERCSGLPAGGAGGESPGDRGALPGSSGSSAPLPADVLDLDEDEDDLELFSKVRAAAAARPGKVPRPLQELPAPRAQVPARSPCRGGGAQLEVGGVPRGRTRGCALAGPQPAAAPGSGL